MKVSRISIIVVLIGLFVNLSAQTIEREFIGTQGDLYKNEEAFISWSFGQIITETFKSDSITLGQGFQPNEIIVSSLESTDAGMDLQIFPNPAYNSIHIISKRLTNGEYFLYGIQGEVLKKGNINQDIEKIDLNDIPVGAYVLQVHSQNGYRTFKIIKL